MKDETQKAVTQVFGWPDASWLRAWIRVDRHIEDQTDGPETKRKICNSVRSVIFQSSEEAIDKIGQLNFDVAHAITNELLELAKMARVTCEPELPASVRTRGRGKPLAGTPPPEKKEEEIKKPKERSEKLKYESELLFRPTRKEEQAITKFLKESGALPEEVTEQTVAKIIEAEEKAKEERIKELLREKPEMFYAPVEKGRLKQILEGTEMSPIAGEIMNEIPIADRPRVRRAMEEFLESRETIPAISETPVNEGMRNDIEERVRRLKLASNNFRKYMRTKVKQQEGEKEWTEEEQERVFDLEEEIKKELLPLLLIYEDLDEKGYELPLGTISKRGVESRLFDNTITEASKDVASIAFSDVMPETGMVSVAQPDDRRAFIRALEIESAES